MKKRALIILIFVALALIIVAVVLQTAGPKEIKTSGLDVSGNAGRVAINVISPKIEDKLAGVKNG